MPESGPQTKTPEAAAASDFRAWCWLIALSIRRQARSRVTVWFALGLLLLTVTVVSRNAAEGRLSMDHWRSPRGSGPTFQLWLETWSAGERLATLPAVPGPAVGESMASGVSSAVLTACRVTLDNSGMLVFSRVVVFNIFLSFLLPIWCLSFATEALGGERESRNLVWLLTRPLSRPAIYAAKFVALLPWSLGLTVGGFGLICLVAGAPGRLAFQVYWPAVAMATLAFCSLFHLLAAVVRRPAIFACLYTFFLEVILGNMPGYMKRISIGFYTRCLMFDAGQAYGVQPPEKESIFLPVEAATAWMVLAGVTVVLLAVGMMVFARSEYHQDI